MLALGHVVQALQNLDSCYAELSLSYEVRDEVIWLYPVCFLRARETGGVLCDARLNVPAQFPAYETNAEGQSFAPPVMVIVVSQVRALYFWDVVETGHVKAATIRRGGGGDDDVKVVLQLLVP